MTIWLNRFNHLLIQSWSILSETIFCHCFLKKEVLYLEHKIKKMEKFLNWIKKLIPAYIEIRSLYWLQYAKELDADLRAIFNMIDEDKYKEAHKLIDIFDEKYNQSFVPYWVAIRIAEIYRAKSMLVFLETPLED
jgi:hypothetical protein